MMVHLTKNEITHLVYLLGHGDGEQPELNTSCLNKLKPLIEVCTCKEDSNAKWTTLHQQNRWNAGEVYRRMWTGGIKIRSYGWLLYCRISLIYCWLFIPYQLYW